MTELVKDIAEAFAKKEVIGFVTWLNRTKYFLMNFTLDGEDVYRDASTPGGPTDHTLSSLYDIYLKNKTNDKKTI